MDFAIYMGDERTVIYKKGQGIVLNEPSIVAYANGKIIAAGKQAQKFANQEDVTLCSPIKGGRLVDIKPAGALFSGLFKKVGIQSVAVRRRCLFCIPSSLSAEELNDYKTAIYSAEIADAEFIPAVFGIALANDYDPKSDKAVLCVMHENNWADIAVIISGEIVSGGTLEDTSKLEAAKAQFSSVFEIKQFQSGGRIDLINGIGKYLENEALIKRIIKAN